MATVMDPILAWLSWPHIVIILVVVLLLFGGQKLPELAKGLAKGLRTFKEEMHNTKKEIEDDTRTSGDAKPEEKK